MKWLVGKLSLVQFSTLLILLLIISIISMWWATTHTSCTIHPTYREVPSIREWRTSSLSGKPQHVSQLKVFDWMKAVEINSTVVIHVAPSGSNKKNIFPVLW